MSQTKYKVKIVNQHIADYHDNKEIEYEILEELYMTLEEIQLMGSELQIRRNESFVEYDTRSQTFVIDEDNNDQFLLIINDTFRG